MKKQPYHPSLRNASKNQRICPSFRKTDTNVSLVAIGGRGFYVYRYEGELNGIPNAGLTTRMIPDAYAKRRLSNCFSGKAKTNRHWISIKSVPAREYRGAGPLCHPSIICAVCIPESAALLRQDISISKNVSRQNGLKISIP